MNKITITLTLCTAMLSILPAKAATDIVSDSEWETLLILDSQLNNLGWATGWDFSNKANANTFTGITVSDGHVTAIDFSNRSLTGALPVAVTQLDYLTSINLSHNNLTGNIGWYVYPLAYLKRLDVSYNKIEELTPYLSTNITSFNADYQTIDKQLDYDVAHISITSLMQIPTIILNDYNTKNNINFYFQPEDGHNFGVGFNNGLFTVSGNNTIYVNSGDIIPVTTDNHVKGMTIKLDFPDGDTNLSGVVDANDIKYTIDRIFKDNFFFAFNAGNTYKDEVINIQDVIATTNKVIGNLTPTSGSAVDNILSMPSLSIERSVTTPLPIHMSCTSDIVGVQFTFTMPKGITIAPSTATIDQLRKDGHAIRMEEINSTADETEYICVITSSQNRSLKGDEGVLLTFDITANDHITNGTVFNPGIHDVILAAPDGENIATTTLVGNLTVYHTINKYDLNDDGKVDNADLEDLRNHILHRATSERFDATRADLNEDNAVNVLDIQMLQNFLNDYDVPPTPEDPTEDKEKLPEETEDDDNWELGTKGVTNKNEQYQID